MRFGLKTMMYLTALIAVYGLVVHELTSKQPSLTVLIGYGVVASVVGYKLGGHVRADNAMMRERIEREKWAD